MGRNRHYANDAERQRAYRERKAKELAQLRGASKRKAVSAKLVKVLGMLGSEHASERDNAALTASRMLKDAGLTWYDVLDIEEGDKK